ncbi:MAG: PsiF family protein [Rudaea sp.]
MKSTVPVFAAIAFALALCAGSASAADTKAPTAQQSKFGACAKSAHAKGLKGDEYKSYMSTCAKADSAGPVAAAPAKPMTQQEKMKSCNADAGTQHLAGDARKTFMSSCLKGNSTAAAPAH